MAILIKKHIVARKLVLAMCDKSILGKKFAENDVQLDLGTGFYDGKELPVEESQKLMRAAQIINVVGKESVEYVLKNGYISDGCIIYISKVPHAQCIKLV